MLNQSQVLTDAQDLIQKSSATAPRSEVISSQTVDSEFQTGKVYFDLKKAIHEFDTETSDQSVDHEFAGSNQVSLLLKNAEVLFQNRDTHLGMALLRQAANVDSWNPEVLYRLADHLEKMNKFDEAASAWNALVKVDNSFTTLFRHANCLYKLNEDERALEKYYEALAILTEDNENVFDAYKNMGNILVRRGDFEGAEELYNKAYTMNPLSDILLVNLGTLEVQRQDYDKAIYCFRKAVEINCDNDKAWVGLSLVHNQYGDHELAWANIETAIEINPKNRTAVHVIGAWATRDQKVVRAIPVLENYLSLVDHDEDMSLALINLYCSQGQLDSAKIEIEKVLLWNPSHKEVRELRKRIRSYRAGVA